MSDGYNKNYAEIVKIIVSDLKDEAKSIAGQSLVWVGDAIYTEKQLAALKIGRKKKKKGAKMLLDALKLLGY